MSQTSVTEKMLRALPGLLGDVGGDYHLRSFGLEGTAEFGLFVIGGTDPEKQVIVPSVSAAGVVGCIAHAQVLSDESGSDLIEGEVVGVVTKGRIWAQTAEAMAVGDAVYVENTGANAGKVRNDATAADLLAEAKVEAYDAETTLVLLSVNLP